MTLLSKAVFSFAAQKKSPTGTRAEQRCGEFYYYYYIIDNGKIQLGNINLTNDYNIKNMKNIDLHLTCILFFYSTKAG